MKGREGRGGAGEAGKGKLHIERLVHGVRHALGSCSCSVRAIPQILVTRFGYPFWSHVLATHSGHMFWPHILVIRFSHTFWSLVCAGGDGEVHGSRPSPGGPGPGISPLSLFPGAFSLFLSPFSLFLGSLPTLLDPAGAGPQCKPGGFVWFVFVVSHALHDA